MKLEGIAQKLIKNMQEEGRMQNINAHELFGKNYQEKIRYIKDNWVYELKEKGINVSSTAGEDVPAYII